LVNSCLRQQALSCLCFAALSCALVYGTHVFHVGSLYQAPIRICGGLQYHCFTYTVYYEAYITPVSPTQAYGPRLATKKRE